MRLLNLTLHRQGEREIALAARYGYELDPEPRGVEVGPGQVGLNNATAELAQRLRIAFKECAAVLVGGHTLALTGAVMALAGTEVPMLVAFETRRIRDEHDRFIFEPIGLITWPPVRTPYEAWDAETFASIARSLCRDFYGVIPRSEATGSCVSAESIEIARILQGQGIRAHVEAHGPDRFYVSIKRPDGTDSDIGVIGVSRPG